MTQYQQTLSIPQYSAAQILALAYGTLQHLGWRNELAVETRLAGCTKKTWGRHHDHVIIDAGEETLTVTSQLPEGTYWDLFKKNKKNVAKFLTAFEETRHTAGPEQLTEWQNAVAVLQEQTTATIKQEEQEAAEVEAVMNLSSGSKTFTYSFIGINVLLFIIMAVSGVHLMEPLVADLVKWGANYKPLTTGGEWWRLLTSTFIHIGLIHLLFNMYALYMAGVYLEPMLGKGRFLTAYLCTGVLASLCSAWWHGSESVSAGASGAIFGLYGVFLALLTTKLIPQSVRKALLQSIGVFVVYNLLYGAKSQAVDNAAHLGGLISGLLIGYLYFFTFRKQTFRPAIAMSILVTATALVSFTFLRSSKNDGALYGQKVEEVVRMEQKAMAPFQSYTSDADLLSKLAQVSQPEWAKAKAVMAETAGYRLDENLSRHRKLLTAYIELRNQYNDLAIISLQGRENVEGEIEALAKKINDKLAEMQKKESGKQ